MPKKNKNDEGYKRHRAAINKHYREKRKSTETTQERNIRLRFGSERLKDKLNKELLADSSEASPSALGKAFKKIYRNVPRSPRKQRATVVKLATKYGVSLENKVLAIKRERLSGDVTNLITEFYVNDEISGVDPSLKGVSSQTA
ncbi:hypothetical protein ANN_19136 [Periplaneta americana]|uniref:Uncharacterized protein n=1 Tax=Periplaneta americana TaxID=6978 RepID=A0ABQ8S9A5_PERAM|nr:hypothetical protein ANN_19136 [Periplaneta americana]